MKKLTQQEIDHAVANGDFTGGYTFFQWIFLSRGKWIYFFASLFLIGLGIFAETNYAMEQSLDTVFQTWAGYVSIAAGIFLLFWTIRMYNRMKKGISD